MRTSSRSDGKSLDERRETQVPRIENTAYPRTMIQPGLRILAKIIAKEVIKDRLAEMDGLESDLPSPETPPVEVGELIEGNAQR